MNLTNRLAAFVRQEPSDAEEAFQVLTRDHPGITRNPDDSYTYRGYRFDYFKSGISMDRAKPNRYTLVDPEDHRNWLFSYGDPEERWADYVAAVERRRAADAPVGFFRRVFNTLFG